MSRQASPPKGTNYRIQRYRSTAALFTYLVTLLGSTLCGCIEDLTVPFDSSSGETNSEISSGTQSGPTAWIASLMVRVGAGDPSNSISTATIYGARRETESFQIIVRAPSDLSLTNVNVSISNLKGPNGAIFASSNFSLFREHYVAVNIDPSVSNPAHNNPRRGSGIYPDALLPFIDPLTGLPPIPATYQAVPFTVPLGANQPIWVDVTIPNGTPRGQYKGQYKITSDQGSFSGDINLTVWNFSLPLTPALKSLFILNASTNPDLKSIGRVLLRNRISPHRIDSSDLLTLSSNFGFSLYNAPGLWANQNHAACTMDTAQSVTNLLSIKNSFPTLSLLAYTADEIHLDLCPNYTNMIKQWGYNLHQAGMTHLVTMPPDPALYDDGSGTGRSAVDYWAQLPLVYIQNLAQNNYVRSKGDEVWSYNVWVQDSDSPKWELDFDPINFRIQPGFISQSNNITGLFYWRVDQWTPDPWTSIDPIHPGDGMLVYPGTPAGIQGVIPSMRLKWIGRGVVDYDYIQLIKNAGKSSQVDYIWTRLGTNWSTWTRDPAALEAARIQMGAALDQ